MSTIDNRAEAPAVEQTSDTPENDTLSKDDIFHLLQTRRRRDALRYLKGTEETVRMRDLAEQVAAWEHETTVDGLTSEQRQRVYISLYQSHLPKLDEEGVIEYDQSRGTVHRTEIADQLDPYLDEANREDTSPDSANDEWQAYYLAAAGLSTLLLAGAAVGVPILSAVPELGIAALIVVLFVSLTVARRILD